MACLLISTPDATVRCATLFPLPATPEAMGSMAHYVRATTFSPSLPPLQQWTALHTFP